MINSSCSDIAAPFITGRCCALHHMRFQFHRRRSVISRLLQPLLFVCAIAGGTAYAQGLESDKAGTAQPIRFVASSATSQTRNRGLHPQLTHVATPVADHYIKADSVALALAVVPDPLVPRYRRLFDLNILALELGMLQDGFLLDRFSFPWSDELRQEPDASAGAADKRVSNISSGSYGLMIFRCDRWRGDPCNYPGADPVKDQGSTRLRALYIVTDTATAGVAPFQLACAILKMEGQTGTASETKSLSAPKCPEDQAAIEKHANVTLLRHPLCPPAPNGHAIVVLGPSFSGTMDSIGSTVEGRIPDASRSICLVSSFASDATNGQVSQKYKTVQIQAVALDNGRKIKHLALLARQLNINPGRDIAILAEASTFGYGVCQRVPGNDPLSKDLCGKSPRFYFPPTIADIAYGLQKQEAQASNELANATRQVEDTHHVPLEAGAENGSEYPASESAGVTSASNQLQLDRVMDELVTLGPKLIVVAATDVRDRLFLFDQLREKLPRAMLIDLEADNLLAHPNFLHASRGSIAMASVNLDSVGSKLYGCEQPDPNDPSRSSWATDGQGLLAQNTAYLYEVGSAVPVSHPCATDEKAGANRQAALQLVTFHGFKPVSYSFPKADSNRSGAPRPRFDLLVFTECIAICSCISLAALWLWPSALLRKHGRAPLDAAVISGTERVCIGAAVFFGILFICCSLIVAFNSTDKPGHALVYWSIAAELIGAVGVWRCYVQIRQTLWASGHASYSSPLLSTSLAIVAVGFPIAAAVISSEMGQYGTLLDPTLLNAIGFDPESGVAFYLVVALAAMMTLYASALLAFRVWVVRRNFRLLTLASRRANSPVPFVARDVDNKPIDVLHGYRPLPFWEIVLLSTLIVFVIGAPGLLDYLGGPRLTVFGPFAAKVAVLALSSTTLCAMTLLSAAFGVGRRVLLLCGYVRGRLLDSSKGTSKASSGIPGLWSGGAEMPIAFPATPALAISSGAGASVFCGPTNCKPGSAAAGKAWAISLSQILYEGIQNSRSRFALFALLVSELSLFRWMAAGAVLCAFASVTIVYLYPIEADTLLILNLVILALAGILCAYLAVVFEREEVLSNIVCNRPKKTQVSAGLFSFIASPFVALAAAIALIGVPGVVDWAGGLFAMLRSLGIHP